LAAIAVACLTTALLISVRTWRHDHRSGITHSQQGSEALSLGNREGAEQKWLAGIESDPATADCYLQLGHLYLEERRANDAVRVLSQAVARMPDNGPSFLMLSRAYMSAQNVSAAEIACRRAAELLPEDADAQGLFGLLEGRLNHNPAALAALQRAHALRPGDRDYLLALIRHQMLASDFPGAEATLSPYLQAHPQDAWANHLMAVINEQKPRTPASIQMALRYEERAYVATPNDPRMAMTLGQLYLAANRPADALRVYSAGLKVAPNSEAMLHGLVSSNTRLRQPAAAAAAAARLEAATALHQRIQHLKDNLGLHPGDISLGLELASLEEQDGDLTSAYRLLQKLIRLAPADTRSGAALAAFQQRHGTPEPTSLPELAVSDLR